MNAAPDDFRAGYAALIGLPNAGKSTLMNALLDIKLSIVSSKPQTTRRRVLGILNKDMMQVVFMDTPGILKPGYTLQEKMMAQVSKALDDADVLLFIVDVTDRTHPVRLDLPEVNRHSKPVLLLLNKIDLLPKSKLLTLIDKYQNHYPFKAIIPISALNSDGIDLLEKELLKQLPLSPPYYPPDLLTDQPERFFIAEIIREKIFERFYQEVPYSTEVVVEEFKERSKGKDYIYAVIMVERKTQKGILIGKGGEMLKKIGAEARKDIQEFLGRDVFLELRVKVNEDWRKKDFKLRKLGY